MTTLDVAERNKIKNEEFKIWKKSIPSLYQHISSLKPNFSSNVNETSTTPKSLVFTNDKACDKAKGTLTAPLLYSQGSEIFEVECVMPLGLHYKKLEGSIEILPQPDYTTESLKVEQTVLTPKWEFKGETIEKMIYVDNSEINVKVIALSANGSLAWFRDGVKLPVYTMLEAPSPLSTASCGEHDGKPNVDFAISNDSKTLVVTKGTILDSESATFKIIDNSSKIGEVVRTVSVSNIKTIQAVNFLNNNIFATCSDDGVIRFWGTEAGEEPLWILNDSLDGKSCCFAVSPFVDTLFVTGTSSGAIKVWDLRAVVSSMDAAVGPNSNQEHNKVNELFKVHHFYSERVSRIEFSAISPTEMITVGDLGNVYHWDFEPVFSSYTETSEEFQGTIADEVEAESMTFYHTEGCRREMGENDKVNTVAYHNSIEDLVATVDSDGLLTVYRPFTGKIHGDETKLEMATD
ncbi:Ume1p [Saccharomyces eubayanus]|uniref:Ume1p n=1 Tax=Saccharomyces eubayanus TaxID=1080349 RepID=UPI0006C4AC1E|nr:UME1-like protein [Saccharomyces eubayanus]KOG96178.1 UME1-like protein [Saccharomyces eubayanus]